MTVVQHCPPCATEYVAGVLVCAECGGPLSPGALADDPLQGRRHQSDTSNTAALTPDMKLIDLPGLQADFAVRALTLEGIVCGVECQGIRKIHLPESPPQEPLAVTLPVSIYVPSDKLSEAQGILRSLEPDDVIGAQWEAFAEEGDCDDGDLAAPSTLPNWPSTEGRERDSPPLADPPRGESTTFRLIVFLVVAALALVLLGR